MAACYSSLRKPLSLPPSGHLPHLELNADSWLWPCLPRPSCPRFSLLPGGRMSTCLSAFACAVPPACSSSQHPLTGASAYRPGLPSVLPHPGVIFLYIPITAPRPGSSSFSVCLSRTSPHTRARIFFLSHPGAQNRVSLMGGARSKVQNESVNEQ